MHLELMHAPVQRRTDVDAHQQVLGGDPLLGEFRHPGADLGKVLADVGAHLLVDLQDLQLDFGILALGLRDRRDELTALTDEARMIALQRRNTVELDELSSSRGPRRLPAP